MSLYTIEINDDAIKEQVQGILNTICNRELGNRYSESGREISAAVKELIYSRKYEIIDMVVDRASREIVKKAMPKLLDKFSD